MHRRQRQTFLDVLARENAAAVIPAGGLRVRNADCDHRFRPTSDFAYLVDFREPNAWLVLLPSGDARAVIFVEEKNLDEETWTGHRLGVEAAPQRLGVDRALPVARVFDELPALLRGVSRIVYRFGEDEARDRRMLEVGAALRRGARAGVAAPTEWIDPSLWLHELRLFKSPEEIALMRTAADVTAEAHLAAMRAAQPGMNEAEIDALLTYVFLRRGATGSAYNNIVAGGANACILHYIENDEPLRDGDLLLIDAGAEWCWYASDVTRTFPVNGRFTPAQRALYEVVLRAQKAAVDAVRPGATFVAAHEVALRYLCDGLIDLGLLAGSVESVIESGAYRRFYMHRTGHWLGLDVHDCGQYQEDGGSRRLAPGMVTTVEPGLYVRADDDTVDPRWRGIGIRIEDDVLVTAAGREVLTAEIPKEVEDVEAACAAPNRLAPVV